MKSKLAILLVALSLAGGVASQAVEFESEILPILSSRCGKCHLDGESKGGVALDMDKISREIGKGKAIVPSDPEKSDLLSVVMLPEGDKKRMPRNAPPLGDREIGMIKTWIEEGAKVGGESAEDPKMAEAQEEEPAKAPAAEPETWTDTNGKSITATIMKVDVARKSVLFKLEGNRTAEVEIAKLSDESKARAREFWEANR